MKRSAFILVLALTLLPGCAKKAPPPPPATYFDHTVTYQGENLGMIASWYTGTANNWNAILDANPDLKPNKLRLGTVVHIPEELVTKREALPQKLLKAKPVETRKEEAVAPAAEAPKESAPAPEVQATPAPVETSAPAETPAPASTSVAEATAQPKEAAPVETPQAAPTEAPPPPAEGSVAVSTPSASDKVKEDLLDEILNPKTEPTK